MRTYLYLRPSVYLWRGKNEWLFYASSRLRQYIFPSFEETDKILKSLRKFENLYSIPVNTGLLCNPRVLSLFSFIHDNSLGGVVRTSKKDEPLSFPPLPLFFDNPLKKGNSNAQIKNLESVTLHLSGRCRNNCKHCKSLYRQMNYCTSSSKELSSYSIRCLYEIIEKIEIKKLNVILSGPYDTDEIIALFNKADAMNILCTYSVHWKNFDFDQVSYVHGTCSYVLFKVLIDLSEISLLQLRDIASSMYPFKGSIILVFAVHDKKDEKLLYSFLRESSLNDFEVHLVSDGFNTSYLERNYYLKESDIKHLKCSRHDILANKFINKGLYGKLYVSSSGDVSFNENSGVIGKLDDDIIATLNSSFRSLKNPWFLTREKKRKTCANCCYRYLCPPVSDVELFMKRQSGCLRYRSDDIA